MERRKFIAVIAGGLLAAPLTAEAQSQARIAFLCVDVLEPSQGSPSAVDTRGNPLEPDDRATQAARDTA